MSERNLELSVRSARVAERVGATTVGELARFTEEEILETKCFGETSLREIKEKLAERGLRLGMTLEEMRGRTGLQARIVQRSSPGPSQTEAEHEHACCGHCEDVARHLRARTERERKLNMSLAELELSVRATNCLEAEGITTVRDLVNRTDEELLVVRGVSETLLKEVKSKLARYGLQLATRG
jgi:DNA-directed RNA polymerase alpha subunit